uniref:Uncharacterized protein n=1 Tax=Anguilla anguilla TaxID=7936 RepID=A0A0E9QD88_ANGAN
MAAMGRLAERGDNCSVSACRPSSQRRAVCIIHSPSTGP